MIHATCLNCPYVFRTLQTALKALREGCPKCESIEIDWEYEGPRIEVGSPDLNYAHHRVVVSYTPSHYGSTRKGAL